MKNRAAEPALIARPPAGRSDAADGELRHGPASGSLTPRAGFTLQRWDSGRLTVNHEFAALLENAALTTFDSLWSYAGGQVAKNLLRERTTTRIVLADPRSSGETACYLKRHAPPPWKEYVKPLIRLRRPIVGARHEWNAILRFHEVGIPTMTPVAVGRCGRRSLLLTQAIEGCRKLSDLLADCRDQGPGTSASQGLYSSSLIARLAHTARRMHAAGLHHQDFYLTHLLVPEADDGETLYVIDLGRVRQRRRLARRWIVKDLAQLTYSVGRVSDDQRRQFLEVYLGRQLRPADEFLIRLIEGKANAIAAHSRKHAL